MKITVNEPFRQFKVGVEKTTTLSDCGRIGLDADEQITFVTGSGSEYDVCRKSWGYYATPSLNARLPEHGLRAVLVRGKNRRYFVMLVEKGREAEFHLYLQSEQSQIVTWLDTTEVLDELSAQFGIQESTLS